MAIGFVGSGGWTRSPSSRADHGHASAPGSTLAIGLGRAMRPHRPGVGRAAPGPQTLWFGVRGQGATVANNVTARLDVAMLPAFVSVSSVGLYSVATSVSLIVYQLSNTFAGLVIPAAAQDPGRGPFKVMGSLLGGACGRRGWWRSGSRCSRGRCSGSCTATTSATRRSRCCCCCRARCCSPARRSSRPASTRRGGPSRRPWPRCSGWSSRWSAW